MQLMLWRWSKPRSKALSSILIRRITKRTEALEKLARVTGLEPATSGVTGRHSNRLSYTRALDVGAGRRVVGGELRRSMGSVKRHRKDNRQSSSSIFRSAQNPAYPLPHLPLRHVFELAERRRTAYCSARLGRLAQLVERFVYTEDVGGSSPSSPTIPSSLPRSCSGAMSRRPAPLHGFMRRPKTPPTAPGAAMQVTPGLNLDC